MGRLRLEMGLTDEEEAVVYEAFPELLPMGDLDLKGLRKLQRSSCNAVGVDNPKKPGKPRTNPGEQEKPRPRKATKRLWRRNLCTPPSFTKQKKEIY